MAPTSKGMRRGRRWRVLRPRHNQFGGRFVTQRSSHRQSHFHVWFVLESVVGFSIVCSVLTILPSKEQMEIRRPVLAVGCRSVEKQRTQRLTWDAAKESEKGKDALTRVAYTHSWGRGCFGDGRHLNLFLSKEKRRPAGKPAARTILHDLNRCIASPRRPWQKASDSTKTRLSHAPAFKARVVPAFTQCFQQAAWKPMLCFL